MRKKYEQDARKEIEKLKIIKWKRKSDFILINEQELLNDNFLKNLIQKLNIIGYEFRNDIAFGFKEEIHLLFNNNDKRIHFSIIIDAKKYKCNFDKLRKIIFLNFPNYEVKYSLSDEWLNDMNRKYKCHKSEV